MIKKEPRRKRTKREKGEALQAYLFLTPGIIIAVVFFILSISPLPICLGIHIKVLACPCIVGNIYL
ncbi:MAG: hypothetical protein RSC33_06580 [Vagococcus sp.]